jgi:hypothetical protein
MVECKVCGAKNALMKTFGIAPGDYCSLECYEKERDRVIAENISNYTHART